jgi:adenylylsulfate kinase
MKDRKAFGVWITGLPASGKSTITRRLAERLELFRVTPVVLESDEMRAILTPEPAYTAEERDRFYRMLALFGAMIVKNGVPVIFDATAHKQAYRDFARSLIPHFAEVFVNCPLQVCVNRDPKGIYAAAASGRAGSVPGLQADYEQPPYPDVTLDCEETPDKGAEAIIRKLKELKFL